MLNKIMYWLGALATFFPLCILPIPFWLSFIIVFAIYFLMMFLPPVSTIVEIIFWVWGIIQLTNMPFSFITVIGILLFIFWLLSTVSFYYGIYQNHKPISNKKSTISSLKNNKQRMLFTIESLIEKMDSINDGHIKCKDVLLKPIKNTIDNCTYAFDDIEDSEFEQKAYQIIYDFSFELLCSGRFHIYRGVLNEMNESTHLMHVCKSCLEWACEHKVITEIEKKEQLEILRDEIRSVG